MLVEPMLINLLHVLLAATVMAAGPVPLQGILTRHSGGYLLDNRIPLRFAQAAPVNGTRFNARSERFFSNGAVRLLAIPPGEAGNEEPSATHLVTAIVQDGPLRITGDPARSDHHRRFSSEGFAFVEGGLFANENTQVSHHFEETVFVKPGYAPRPGDGALIISLSGRQGDDLTAAGGHFAAGAGTLREDEEGLWLDGDLFNIYVRNEKGIIPGVTPWAEYFGGITGGQDNYRPTWTMVVYGVQPERLRRLRESFESHYPLFRSGELELTLNYNCTTITVQALAAIGVYGTHRRGVNGSADYPLIPAQPQVPPVLVGIPDYVSYLFSHDFREVFPRNAWVSILGNLQWLKSHERLNIDRVDLIFQPQVPSSRMLGGAPANDLGDGRRLYMHAHETPEEVFEALNQID